MFGEPSKATEAQDKSIFPLKVFIIAEIMTFSLDSLKEFWFWQMLTSVRLEMETFAEMASVSIQWDPSSVNAMKATRWPQTGGPVWVRTCATQDGPGGHSEKHVSPF